MYNKGVVFDIGYGMDSFNFYVVEIVLCEGMKVVLISIDIYICNWENGFVYDLVIMMEKFCVVGYDWLEIIEKVIKVFVENFYLM